MIISIYMLQRLPELQVTHCVAGSDKVCEGQKADNMIYAINFIFLAVEQKNNYSPDPIMH